MGISLDDLIKDGRTIENGLRFIPPRQGVIRLYAVYGLEDNKVYYRWKELAIRFLQLYYPNDLSRFEKYSEDFERNHFAKQYISNMIGVLEACLALPSGVIGEIQERDADISRVEKLEQEYVSLTSEDKLHLSSTAFHNWHAEACVLFDKWFYPTDEDWIKFQNIEGSGNGYTLNHEFDSIYSSYKKLIARLKEGRGLRGSIIPRPEPRNYRAKIDGKINIFISYAHTDEKWLDRLTKHLKVLARYTGSVEYWEDKKLRGGDIWRTEITKEINKANVAILLVSTDFLASDFITSNELPPILNKAEKDGCKVIPLIVSPCAFEFSEISKFQAVNSPDRTLSDLGGDDAAIERVYLELVKVIQSLLY